MNEWPGELVMGQGWSCYSGQIGDADLHRHSAVQICVAPESEIEVEVDSNRLGPSAAIVIGSNVRHRLRESTGVATLFFIESGSVLGSNIHRVLASRAIHIPDSTVQLETRRVVGQNDLSLSGGLLRQIVTGFWPALDIRVAVDPIDSRVRQTLAAMEMDIASPFSLRDAAKRGGLSESRLRHLFTEQVGLSPSSFLLWKKLQRAVRSLHDQSSLTIAAHEGGFADSAHMSRTFRRMFGISPSDLASRGTIRLDTSADSLLMGHSTAS